MSHTAFKRNFTVVAKTASYTVTAADWGTLFTNRGDTDGITFTLPAVTTALAGMEVSFYCVAGQTLAVAGTAGELVTFNDATANSVALSTSSEKIGGMITAICDGTSWLIVLSTEETQTVTVAT